MSSIFMVPKGINIKTVSVTKLGATRFATQVLEGLLSGGGLDEVYPFPFITNKFDPIGFFNICLHNHRHNSTNLELFSISNHRDGRCIAR